YPGNDGTAIQHLLLEHDRLHAVRRFWRDYLVGHGGLCPGTAAWAPAPCVLYHHYQHHDAAVAGHTDPPVSDLPHAQLGRHAAAADRAYLFWQRLLYLSSPPVLSHHPRRDGGCRSYRRRQRIPDF